ncbi:MAG: oligosaccharide flippase family protein [Butyrivibrio sp.]|nr:oligosaccharide flippase family protein [Butyrivibrio sp.]
MNFLKNKNENSQVFFNILSTILSSGIAFFTMPLFTRLLGAEQYGLFSVYNSWLLIFTCIMGLNVGAGIGTGYYRFSDNYSKFRNSTLLEGSTISVSMIVILLVLYPLLNKLYPYPFILFLFLLLQSFSQFVINIGSLTWTYEKKASVNLIVSSCTVLLTTGISIVLLLTWNSNEPLYYARVIGAAVPTIIIGLVVWIMLFAISPAGYNAEYWKFSFFFGLPMVFHQLSHQVLAQSDRVMMQMFDINGKEIGVYSFYYSLTAVLTTVLLALNNSWCPFLYDGLKEKDYDKLNRKVCNYVQVFTIIAMVFVMLCREVSMLFANEEYWSGMPLVPILVLVVYLTFIYQFAVNYEFFMAKPKYVAVGTTVAGVLNIILNALLIPRWGMYGAAIATLISYIILAVIHFTVVRLWKYDRYPLSYTPVMMGLAAVIAACIGYKLLDEFMFVRWGISICLSVYLVIQVFKRKTVF